MKKLKCHKIARLSLFLTLFSFLIAVQAPGADRTVIGEVFSRAN
jgi:hypothetical protein